MTGERAHFPQANKTSVAKVVFDRLYDCDDNLSCREDDYNPEPVITYASVIGRSSDEISLASTDCLVVSTHQSTKSVSRYQLVATSTSILSVSHV